MASVSSVNPVQRPVFGPPRFEVSLKEVLITTVQKVSREYQEKKALLDKGEKVRGIVYPQDVYYSCEKHDKEEARQMIQRGDCYHGRVSSEYFIHVESSSFPMKLEPYTFSIRPGKLPSEALDALEKDLSLMDCGNVTELGCYRALQCVLGIPKFDALFSAENGLPLTFGMAYMYNPLQAILKLDFPASEEMIPEGALCAFNNHPAYRFKTSYGANGAINAVCIGVKNGVKHYVSMGTKPEGVASMGMNLYLIEGYNHDRSDILVPTEVHDFIQSEMVKINPVLSQAAEVLKSHQLSYSDFQQDPKAGIQLTKTFSLDIDKVRQLIKESSLQGQKLLKNWQANVIQIYREANMINE